MRYYLQVSVESCLDVANHVIAAEKYRAPKDYADSFAVLQDENVIPPGIGHAASTDGKISHRLVHLYGDIDDRKVHATILTDLEDIRIFKSLIVQRFCHYK